MVHQQVTHEQHASLARGAIAHAARVGAARGERLLDEYVLAGRQRPLR
jgi:hypothetical protein